MVLLLKPVSAGLLILKPIPPVLRKGSEQPADSSRPHPSTFIHVIDSEGQTLGLVDPLGRVEAESPGNPFLFSLNLGGRLLHV